jgi:2-polyprenyl-6-methoxyphenol hydroxylase-like FAD-dependent oxidoreductase
MRALVIGAGIGGLTAAVALQRSGVEVAVFERMPELRELGAGLSLWPNAIKALRKLGLGAQLAAISMTEPLGRIYSWNGTLLAETPASSLVRRFGAPELMVHRADLQAMLAATLGSAALHLNKALVHVAQDSAGVTARFADGTQKAGDLLIGADGIHSVVRKQLFGPIRPRYAGYTAWRGIAPFAYERWSPGTGFQSWGRGSQVGFVRIDRERVYWFATKNAPPDQPDAPEGRKQELLARFGGWHVPIPAVISATPEAAILRNDIYDLPPLPHWSMGRVTLLGDAAHATTPNLGQGACQAIEDAVVLARCLRAASTIPAALQRYERRRIKRTTMIATTSRRIGWVAQWQNPLACRLRDALMRRIPARVTLDGLTPIIGYEV